MLLGRKVFHALHPCRRSWEGRNGFSRTSRMSPEQQDAVTMSQNMSQLLSKTSGECWNNLRAPGGNTEGKL